MTDMKWLPNENTKI